MPQFRMFQLLGGCDQSRIAQAVGPEHGHDFPGSASNGSQMPRFLVPMQLCRVPHPHEIRESGKVLETA
jgi:hypothetical protein